MKFNILGTFLFSTVIISKFKKGMADPSTNTTVTCEKGEMLKSDIDNIRSKCIEIGGNLSFAYHDIRINSCYSNINSIQCTFCNHDQEDVFYSSHGKCLPRELNTGEDYCLPGDLFNEKVEEFKYKCKYYGGNTIGSFKSFNRKCYETAKFYCRLEDYYGPHSIIEVRSRTTSKPPKAITKSAKVLVKRATNKSAKVIPTRTTSKALKVTVSKKLMSQSSTTTQSYFPTNLPKEERVKSFIDFCKNSNGYFDESYETCVLCSYGYVPDHINGSCKQEIPEFECQTPADLEVAKQKCEAMGGFIKEFETVNNCSISTCYFCPIGYIQSNGKCVYKYDNPITQNKSATTGLKTITTQATKTTKTLTTKVVITTSIPSTTHTLLPTKKVTTTTLLLPTNLSGQGAPLSTCYPKTITVTEKKNSYVHRKRNSYCDY